MNSSNFHPNKNKKLKTEGRPRKIVTIGIITITLSSCAPMTVPGPPPLTAAEIATADYGTPPPENYEEIIKESIRDRLIDPTSPIFEIGSPRKGYTNRSAAIGTSQAFGWRVCGTVNSKNRMGGYTGKVPFFTLFQGDVLVKTIIGEVKTNIYAKNYLNISIEAACNRQV